MKLRLNDLDKTLPERALELAAQRWPTMSIDIIDMQLDMQQCLEALVNENNTLSIENDALRQELVALLAAAKDDDWDVIDDAIAKAGKVIGA